VSDGPELTPEDVQEILRLVDESGLDELELETPRFSLRVKRGDLAAAAGQHVPADGLAEVRAPTVGTFYRAPAPGDDPFVDVGSHVDEDSVVCIVEVMKLMSSVTAGMRGTIAEVCVENAAPVQYGDVLFRVRPL
jgi:acetyl-CoA carboxylase biotin carboxyl carrier protein